MSFKPNGRYCGASDLHVLWVKPDSCNHLGMHLDLFYSAVVVSTAKLEAAVSQVERQAPCKWWTCHPSFLVSSHFHDITTPKSVLDSCQSHDH